MRWPVGARLPTYLPANRSATLACRCFWGCGLAKSKWRHWAAWEPHHTSTAGILQACCSSRLLFTPGGARAETLCPVRASLLLARGAAGSLAATPDPLQSSCTCGQCWQRLVAHPSWQWVHRMPCCVHEAHFVRAFKHMCREIVCCVGTISTDVQVVAAAPFSEFVKHSSWASRPTTT